MTYREAAGRGLGAVECLDLTRAAYLDAGGEPVEADLTITAMIASLSHERSEWLWGPMERWRGAPRAQPLADGDPFEAVSWWPLPSPLPTQPIWRRRCATPSASA